MVVVENAVDGWACGLEAYALEVGIVEDGCFDGWSGVWVVDDEAKGVGVWYGEHECFGLCGGFVNVGNDVAIEGMGECDAIVGGVGNDVVATRKEELFEF